MALQNRKAFTLVELLVVIVIIGMLAALLLPAVTGARIRARQSQCENNQRNLGQAVIQYEVAKGYLPGYINRLGANGVDDDGDGAIDEGDETAVSWAVMVFEYMGQGDLWKKWRNANVLLAAKVNPDPANTDFASVKVPLLICPTDDPTEIAPLSYVVNCGLSDYGLRPPPPPIVANTDDVLALEGLLGSANAAAGAVQDRSYGLFFNHWIEPPSLRTEVSLGQITDGAGNTIILSENINASQWATTDASVTPPLPRPPRQLDVGMLWWSENVPPGAVTRGDGRLINDDPDIPPSNPRYLARPSSNHPGGAVVTFADGHTAFQSEDIDYSVYQSLMTPEVSKAKKQGLVSP